MDRSLFETPSKTSSTYLMPGFSSEGEGVRTGPRPLHAIHNDDQLNLRRSFIEVNTPNIVMQALVSAIGKRLGLKIRCVDVISAIAWKAFALSVNNVGHEISRLQIVADARSSPIQQAESSVRISHGAVHTFDAIRTASLANIVFSMITQQRSSMLAENGFHELSHPGMSPSVYALNIYFSDIDSMPSLALADDDGAKNIVIFPRDLWSTCWRYFDNDHATLGFEKYLEHLVFDGDEQEY